MIYIEDHVYLLSNISGCTSMTHVHNRVRVAHVSISWLFNVFLCSIFVRRGRVCPGRARQLCPDGDRRQHPGAPSVRTIVVNLRRRVGEKLVTRSATTRLQSVNTGGCHRRA